MIKTVEKCGVHPCAVLDDCRSEIKEAKACLEYLGLGLATMTGTDAEENALLCVCHSLERTEEKLFEIIKELEGAAI